MVAVGSIIAGKVAKVTNYGAFVDLEGGGSGMIHISEVANTYVKDINDYLHVGEEVTVKVIGINEQGKVSLSIKETMQKGPQQSQGQSQRRQNVRSEKGDRYPPGQRQPPFPVQVKTKEGPACPGPFSGLGKNCFLGAQHVQR